MRGFGPVDRGTEKIIYGWLLLAVMSLVFAGIFALLVAMARTPVIEDLLPLGRDYIYVALVGHVDLAVVIWFLAFEGFLWALTSTAHTGTSIFSRNLGLVSVILSALGMALVVVSAIFGLGPAELANYVPVLVTPVFYAGLLLFASGILLNLINTLFTLLKVKRDGKKFPVLTFGMAVAGVAVFSAFLCFALSGYYQWATGKIFIDSERLFWGGGHILQFANTVSMVTVWIYLSRLVLKEDPVSPPVAKVLFIFYLLFVLPAPFIYFFHDTAEQAYKDIFTNLMRWGLGPSTAIFMLASVWKIFSGKRLWRNPGFSSLALSIAVFVLGGVIALLISGVNTKIPAHYHCVIGAVTIAFMGLFYEVVPAFNRALWSKRMAAAQPYLYSLGILLFAVGLYMAGSHGVARKTYGHEQNLNNIAKVISMSIMGIGGLVAIAGGITFVLNALLTLVRRQGEDAGSAADHEAVGLEKL
ncbi:MAG: cbb3-type cytochrome c oxidase subunit I [Deltaproteobacteria bacterium]|nr:cbb3-type cytochrome c oxidase subunit I [Deltaproteobacteria bacterium]